ncbi:hypothetical protein [Solicola gregarius]|uniref:MmcQ/YjbR family DNA-binding protein n=1 Tax=Solicola gregarius TaxID=2908642 RepID=A0AA46TFF2_9ACTN|nr:hypothetical protein [Solicola gregarius]UYM04160.1 hypothetical protein L0C25_16640 [Solicola gregarius]
MDLDDVDRIGSALDGVSARTNDGRREWRLRGRLIARELDERYLVIRAEFDVRDLLLRQSPETFSVPRRYEKHMMVVADVRDGDAGEIEDAIVAAWNLQSRQ